MQGTKKKQVKRNSNVLANVTELKASIENNENNNSEQFRINVEKETVYSNHNEDKINNLTKINLCENHILTNNNNNNNIDSATKKIDDISNLIHSNLINNTLNEHESEDDFNGEMEKIQLPNEMNGNGNDNDINDDNQKNKTKRRRKKRNRKNKNKFDEKPVILNGNENENFNDEPIMTNGNELWCQLQNECSISINNIINESFDQIDNSIYSAEIANPFENVLPLNFDQPNNCSYLTKKPEISCSNNKMFNNQLYRSKSADFIKSLPTKKLLSSKR